ncbi:MAG: patatin-like phospholipase family protein [Candidatus Dormibacteraceae bacterium]
MAGRKLARKPGGGGRPGATSPEASMIGFVLTGGASLGAVQVGMLQALARRGIRPDFLIGSSAGALNAAFMAGRDWPASIVELERVWLGLRRHDVFPMALMSSLLGLIGRREYVVSRSGVEALIRRNIPDERIEEAAIPWHVMATDVLSGAEVRISRGSVIDALSASIAIPGVFPPVHLGHHYLMDGGIANNAPISHAIDLGAAVVYVLPAGYACGLKKPPGSALGMAIHALSLVLNQKLVESLERCSKKAEVKVVPPLCPVTVSPVDFGHAAELIARARESTARWLGQGEPLRASLKRLQPHNH